MLYNKSTNSFSDKYIYTVHNKKHNIYLNWIRNVTYYNPPLTLYNKLYVWNDLKINYFIFFKVLNEFVRIKCLVSILFKYTCDLTRRTKSSNMPKKAKVNKLARMSDEERARYLQHRADLEEEARRKKRELVARFIKVHVIQM